MAGSRRGGEFARIRWIRDRADGGSRIVVGPGDDAAVLRPQPGEDWVWTIDALVEGVHFRAGWLTPEELGRKSVEISLSDLAAMGARPVALLVAAEIPSGFPERSFRGIFRGIREALRGAGAALAGGNLARSPGPLAIATTAIGRLAKGRAILRSGARPADEIWTTGDPGAAALGREAIERFGRRRALRRFRPYVDRFARPRARIREALWLSRLPLRAMIDTSDGLVADLAHLLEESGVGAALDLPPPDPRFASLAARAGCDPVELILSGGEDYELLLCAPEGAIAPARATFERRFGIALRRIGRITPGARIRARIGGWRLRTLPRGFDHFA